MNLIYDLSQRMFLAALARTAARAALELFKPRDSAAKPSGPAKEIADAEQDLLHACKADAYRTWSRSDDPIDLAVPAAVERKLQTKRKSSVLDPTQIEEWRRRWEAFVSQGVRARGQNPNGRRVILDQTLLDGSVENAFAGSASPREVDASQYLPVRVDDWIAIWDAAATFIGKWRKFAAIVDAALGRIGLANEAEKTRLACRELSNRISQRNAHRGVSRVLPGILFPAAGQLLRDARRELDRCENYLNQIEGTAVIPADDVIRWQTTSDEVHDFLERSCNRWIPVIVEELQREVEPFGVQLGGAGAGDSAGVGDSDGVSESSEPSSQEDPTVHYLNRILDSLDAVQRSNPGEDLEKMWAATEHSARKMFVASGRHDWTFRLLRDDKDGRFAIRRESGVSGETEVVRTGWLLAKDKKVRGRKVELRVSPPPFPLAGPLRDFEVAATRYGRFDQDFKYLADQLIASFTAANYVTVVDWWSDYAKDLECPAWLFRYLLRVTCMDAPQADLAQARLNVLNTLSAEGFRIESGTKIDGAVIPVLLPTPGTERAAPLLVAGAEAQLAPLSTLVLVTPGDAYRFPSRALAVPERWMIDRPLVRCVVESQLLIDCLRTREPNWEGWRLYYDDLVLLVHEGQRPNVATAGRRESFPVSEFFQALYRRSRDRKSKNKRLTEMYFELARLFYNCLSVEMNVRLDPKLDLTSLEPLVDFAELSSTEFQFAKWIRSEEIGSPIEVEEFGVPAKIVIGAGSEVTDAQLEWLNTPLPEADESVGAQLAAWLAEVKHRLCAPLAQGGGFASPRSLAASLLEEFRSAPGRIRLDELMRNFLRLPPNHEARAVLAKWIEQLRRIDGLPCYPHVDVSTGSVAWPSKHGPDPVFWRFDDRVDLRGLLGDDVRFSPDPAEAHGTFSLGKRVAGETTGIAADLLDVAKDEALRSRLPEFLAAAERLWRFAVTHALTGEQKDLAALSDAVLQTLPGSEDYAALPQNAQESLCRGFALLGRFLEGFDVHFVPSRFEYGKPMSPKDLDAEDRSPRPVRFGPGLSGDIVVRRLGLRNSGGRNIRDSEVFVSAGSAPPFYEELTEELEKANAPETAPLVDELRTWPVAQQESELETAVVQKFYPAFWKQLGDVFQAREPAGFRRMRSLLEQLLDAQFRIVSFEPNVVQAFPDGWVRIEGPPNGSGRVRRVRRPGLHGDNRSLKVQAVVELE